MSYYYTVLCNTEQKLNEIAQSLVYAVWQFPYSKTSRCYLNWAGFPSLIIKTLTSLQKNYTI